MDASRARIVAELVGLGAVVISLLLLTYELNQANSLAKFSVASEINQHYNQSNLLQASSSEYADVWLMLAEEDRELTPVELQKAIGLAYYHRNAWNSVETAYLEGWITRDKYQATLNDIEAMLMDLPGIRPHIRLITKNMAKNREITETEQLVLRLSE